VVVAKCAELRPKASIDERSIGEERGPPFDSFRECFFKCWCKSGGEATFDEF